MSRFSLLSRTSLVALSLALGMPLPSLAQDPPVAAQGQALVWTSVERFGIVVPVPEGAPVTDDVDTPADRSYAVNTSEGSSPGIRVGIKVLTPDDLAELPAAPGADGFTAFLSQIGGVPVQATGVVVQLGARALHAYGGSGTRTAPDGARVQARMLFLVAHDLDAMGQGLLLAFYAQGMDPEAAAQAEAEFASRLAVALVAEAAPPVAVDSGVPPVVLIDGLAALAVTSGDVIVRTESNDDGVDVRLTNEQGQLLRVMALFPDAAMVDQLRRFVGRVDSVVQAEMGGQPVWVMQAITQRPPIGRRTEGNFPMTLVVPQFCLAGGEILAVAVISDAGLEAAAQTLLQGLTFSRPEGAESCAGLASLPEALTAPREAVAPEPTSVPVPPVVADPVPQPAAPDAVVQDGKLPATAEAPQVVPQVAPQVAPPQEPAPVLPDLSSLNNEFALWAEAVSQNRPQGFWTYLKAYPDGQFVELARVMLQAPVAMAQPVAPAPAQPAK